MTTLVLIVIGLVLALGAGLVLYLFAGAFLAGRYARPSERRRENRHKFRRRAAGGSGG